MNEQVDNVEYEFLWKLLANPADPNHSHIFNLQSLVSDFPQSGVLRALLMPNGDKRNLKHSAAYFDPGTLYKLSTAPDKLRQVSSEQIVQNDEPSPVPANTYFRPPVVAEPFVPPVEEPAEHFHVTDDDVYVAETVEQEEELPNVHNAFIETEQPVADNNTYETYNSFNDSEKSVDEYQAHEVIEDNYTEPVVQEIAIENNPVTEPVTQTEDRYNAYQPETVADTQIEPEQTFNEIEAAPVVQEVAPEPIVEESLLAKEYNEYMTQTYLQETEPVSSYDTSERYFHQDIDDEVYDEIVSIEDIGLEQLAILDKEAQIEPAETETSNVAEDNYFIFEPAIEAGSKEPVEVALPLQATPAAEYKPAPQMRLQEGSKNNVSRYNDEKMPYTFMWWLDKTRKDHADIYQPYAGEPSSAPPPAPAAKPKKKDVADELQQQYYENIVSISSINDLEAAPKNTAPALNRKEDKIIERFIQDVPQIKHPSGTKLDNENKAKKSSEDKDELVTETLARIYTEQMLYHKAIMTYKKLMLKFPEKSLYFAGQIEQLENKIN